MNNMAAMFRAALVALLVLQVATSTSLALDRKSKCPPARDQEMDTCASQMGFLGDHSFRVPKNMSTMNVFCQNLKNSITCIQSYARDCLQGFTKQILTSLLKRGKQQYNQICQDDQAKRDLMKRMDCIEEKEIELLHGCMDASITRFEYIRDNVKPEHRLPSLCCSYQIFNRDLYLAVDKVCGPQAAPQSGASDAGVHGFLRKVVTGTTGEFFQLICDNHRSMRECQTSEKTRDTLKRLELVTRSVNQGKMKPKNKSLIPPLLAILDSSDPVE